MNSNNTNYEWMKKVRWVMWGFPEPTQTFIHREMEEMLRIGIPLKILAGVSRKCNDLSPALEKVKNESCLYLPHPLIWFPRGLFRGLTQRPLSFLKTLTYAFKLPHRDQSRRLRMLTMAVAAADCASELQKDGDEYFHAHFASYHTEWAMCLGKMLNKPFGGTFHAVGIWKDKNILKEKIEQSQVILTCTQYNLDHLHSLSPKSQNKVHLVYHGLHLSKIGEPTDIDKNDFTWIAIGRLIPKKGFNDLLDAAKILKDQNVNFNIKIVGDGPLKEALEKQISQLDISSQVSLLGSIENSEVWDLLKSARGLVAPSVRDKEGNIDGIPNVILEAMTMARPIIGSKLSGIPEVVQDDLSGILVDPHSPKQIAKAIKTLNEDWELSQSLGQGARNNVKDSFDVTYNINQQLSFLKKASRNP